MMEPQAPSIPQVVAVPIPIGDDIPPDQKVQTMSDTEPVHAQQMPDTIACRGCGQPFARNPAAEGTAQYYRCNECSRFKLSNFPPFDMCCPSNI